MVHDYHKSRILGHWESLLIEHYTLELSHNVMSNKDLTIHGS